MFSERQKALQMLKDSAELRKLSKEWQVESTKYGYSYTKDWLGLPIIQRSDDIVMMAELLHRVKPSVVIETGIARGGSLSFFASMLCMLDVMEGIDPRSSGRKVIGIDIDIRSENRKALDAHPLRFKMDLIQGSSIDDEIIENVHKKVAPDDVVLVSLDSNHTHEHVYQELNAYGNLVTPGSYCVVFDTVIEDLPEGSFPNRPWDIGNNPKTAVYSWLKQNPSFSIDQDINNSLLITVAPDGYLKRNY